MHLKHISATPSIKQTKQNLLYYTDKNIIGGHIKNIEYSKK